MEEFIEVTGKDEKDAVMNAAEKLLTPRENLYYEVVDPGSTGFLGMFSKPARIKARRKTDEEIEAGMESVAKPVQAVREEKKTEVVKPVVEKAETTRPRKEMTISETQVKETVNKFLSDVFKAMEMEVHVDVTLNQEEETLYIDLSGEEMGLLIGKRGQTLDALQCILKNVVNKEVGGHLRVKIDTENYRKRREETLASLANNIASRVKRTRQPVELEAMRSYERRIIHATLQDNKYVETKSEGEEPYRHVVVYPKKNAYYNTGSYGNRSYNKPYRKSGYNRNYRNNRATTTENAPASSTENNE